MARDVQGKIKIEESMKSSLRGFLIALATIGIMLILSQQARAKEGELYGVVSTGFVSNELANTELDKFSYKLAVGYELEKQWSLEFGYQSMGEDVLSPQELTLNNQSVEVNALSLSALGKASNRHGELYYRIGVLNVDSSQTFLKAGLPCSENESTLTLVSDSLSICQTSNSEVAAVLGRGFDFYLHHSTLVRFEVEGIKGADDYSAYGVFIGFRLNF